MLTDSRVRRATLLNLVKDKVVRLEEYARDLIGEEVAHQDEVTMMLPRPGQTALTPRRANSSNPEQEARDAVPGLCCRKLHDAGVGND